MLVGEVPPHLGQRDRTFTLPVPPGLWQLCYVWPWWRGWLWFWLFGRLAFIDRILLLSCNDRIGHCLFDSSDGPLAPIVIVLDLSQLLPKFSGGRRSGLGDLSAVTEIVAVIGLPDALHHYNTVAHLSGSTALGANIANLISGNTVGASIFIGSNDVADISRQPMLLLHRQRGGEGRGGNKKNRKCYFPHSVPFHKTQQGHRHGPPRRQLQKPVQEPSVHPPCR